MGQELPAPAEDSLSFELVEFCVGDQPGGQTALSKAFLARRYQLLNVVLTDNRHVLLLRFLDWAA